MEQVPEEMESRRPWHELEALLETGDPAEIAAFMQQQRDGEAAHTLSLLSEADRERVLTLLSAEEAADVLSQLPEVQAADLLSRLPPEVAAPIVQERPSDEQADLLGELEPGSAEAILQAMAPGDAIAARRLSAYDEETAGGLMATEVLAFARHSTVGEVIENLRRNRERYRDYEVQYAYVTDTRGKLVGVLPMRDLLLGDRDQAIGELMIREPLTVPVAASLEELDDFFERHHFLGVPAVDEAGRLVGVVHRRAVERALGERADSDYRRSQGIVSEEIRTMPVALRSRRRLSWLSVNVVLNIISASVIGLYLDTLDAVIALAVFIPIISDMSGCTGNQAVAVSIRELSMGLVRPHEALRVWGKELSVGVISGTVLGLIIAAVAWAWKGNPWLGLVVGVAMALNTLVAVSIGGTVPLLLKRLRLDPALASGPILTTVTDMCGFFLILSFAAALLPLLT